MILVALPIFPEGALASSVVTTVWVGVFVLALFNLRLGWTLSGLVVPGYLVPLIIIKPLAALVILGEAVLAYFIVWLFSQRLSSCGMWSSFFGRDRFFALVLASILVKVGLDGYLLPWVTRLTESSWLAQYDFSNNLHSFGLIIIPLIANQFWKPGLRRGLLPLFTTVGLTYLIVRYPLMHWTNFSVGSLEYMYEDVSSSLLASTKSYIVLITTAFLSSRMNLHYSWDFNGILIPSLLALQWYEPLKILTSFLEAWVVYCTASQVVKLPVLKEITIEGARKLLLFFNISFVYKLCLGHILVHLAPTSQATDWFGFGYLLPCLMAVKMHDKGILERLTRATLQISVLGAVVAGLLGFTLTLIPWKSPWSAPPTGAAAEPGGPANVKLVDLLREDKVEMYESRLASQRLSPMQMELDAFATGLRHLHAFSRSRDPEELARSRARLRDANFHLIELETGILYLREFPPRRGRGVYAVQPGEAGRMLVEVPAPLQEWATPEAGAYLLQLFDCGALAISTGGENPASPSREEFLSPRRTFFEAFHRAFGRKDVLQVRGYTATNVRLLYGLEADPGSMELPAVSSSLWVKSDLPRGLRLNILKGILEDIRVEWKAPPIKNHQRDATSAGFVELFLTRDDRKRMLARFLRGPEAAGGEELPGPEPVEKLDGDASLQEWLLKRKLDIAPRGSNLYVPPSLQALLFFDEEVLTPLVDLVSEARGGSVPADNLARDIKAIQAASMSLNYALIRHRDADSGAEYLILTESPWHSSRRYWGNYVFRLGECRPYAVEIPHPVFERNTLEYGLSLFEKLNAACLLVAGSHPKCNTDSTADAVLPENKCSLFSLVNQVMLREAGGDPFFAVQVRAFGHKPGAILPEADALLGFADGSTGAQAASQLGAGVLAVLEKDQLAVKFVDGSLATAGYEASGSAQVLYLPQTRNKEFATLWLSPYLRIGYRQDADSLILQEQFAALGIESSEENLHGRITGEVIAGPAVAGPLRRLLEAYQNTRDINALRAIQAEWPGYRLHRLIDRSARKSFLLIFDGTTLLPLVTNLSYNPGLRVSPHRESEFPAAAPLQAADVKRFIESAAPFLLLEQAP